MIKVGVIRGILNKQTQASLESGGRILSLLSNSKLKEKYKPVDIFIEEGEKWYLNGVKIKPDRLRGKIDIAINTIYGDFGEDGKIQKILEKLDIPHIGSSSSVSAFSYDKGTTKKALVHLNIKTPRYALLPAYFKDLDSSQNESKEEEQKREYALNKARDIWAKLSPPWITKPLTSGSSLGVRVNNSFEALVFSLIEAADKGISLLAEEFIKGQEGSIITINNFRNKEVYTFLPVEIIIPEGRAFCDNELKNSEEMKIICPGNFKPELSRQIEKVAELTHEDLGLRYYSKIDFIVTKKDIYIIEINSIPDYRENGILDKSLEAVGSNMEEFLLHSLDSVVIKR